MEFNILSGAVAHIDAIVGGNEFAAGAVIAGLMGVATYSARKLPLILWGLLQKHTTTSLELNSTNDSYHGLAKYLEKKGFVNNARAIKIGNGRHGYGANQKQIGYGNQIFWVNWHTPILITNYKEDSTSDKVKEFLRLTRFGRSHAFFDEMLDQLDKENGDFNSTKFYRYTDGCQQLVATQPKKRIDTVFIPSRSMQKLYAAINSFGEREPWYIKHQIPYQLGILLYGPPGTGKTSLIKAIAAYMDKAICYVASEDALVGAAQGVNDAIIVVEEADTFCMDKRSDAKDSDSELTDMIQAFDKKVLGKILNALDGIISNHGRVIILTTNHIEVLDSALLRPGRVDIQLEIGYMCSETLDQMLSQFFPGYASRSFDIAEGVSPCEVQNDIILGLKPEELIAKYKK